MVHQLHYLLIICAHYGSNNTSSNWISPMHEQATNNIVMWLSRDKFQARSSIKLTLYINVFSTSSSTLFLVTGYFCFYCKL